MRILDFGSGNTCKNDIGIIENMIDALAEVDKERKFIIKWQLFTIAGDNIPLKSSTFYHAYMYARKKGFYTSASVFDLYHLKYLLSPLFINTSLPPLLMIKIANKRELYYLVEEIPRKIPVIVSRSNNLYFSKEYKYSSYKKEHSLCCISKYPAHIRDYDNKFDNDALLTGISDHTTNWDLFLKYQPEIYECHFKLSDSEGLDAGDFARTPEQIKEIYHLI